MAAKNERIWPKNPLFPDFLVELVFVPVDVAFATAGLGGGSTRVLTSCEAPEASVRCTAVGGGGTSSTPPRKTNGASTWMCISLSEAEGGAAAVGVPRLAISASGEFAGNSTGFAADVSV